MSERLILVTRFEELQPGVRVRCHGCPVCSGFHDGMLLSGVQRLAFNERTGDVADVFCYPMVPTPTCFVPRRLVFAGDRLGSAGGGVLIAEEDVAERTVYRWLDFDAKTDASTTQRERERVR